MFDVRCLPNPHWDAALRPLTGRDPAVVAHLDAQPEAGRMVEDIAALAAEFPRKRSTAPSSMPSAMVEVPWAFT
ncbi:glmZ(sRNA)-inactivating NTPase [compost metagenome]